MSEPRLARGPLRPRLRMRLHLDYWSATSTVLELVPCQRVRPGAAYFRAGRDLLGSLARTLPPHMPVHQQAAARVPQDALNARDRTGWLIPRPGTRPPRPSGAIGGLLRHQPMSRPS